MKIMTLVFVVSAVATAAGQVAGDLLVAVKAGDAKQVATLLAKGADPNARGEKGATPLLVASARNQIEVVELLVSKGAELNAQDTSTQKLTPLMVAAFRGHARVVELLLDKGADPTVADWQGLPAATYAAIAGHKALAQAIVKRGGTFPQLDIVKSAIWIPTLPADGRCFEHLEQSPCGPGANPK